jgi:CheY-like chemotaxis protein
MIINNLLSNALKYTKTGHVKLTIEENNIEPLNSQVAIIVEDTGIGIKEKDYDRVFMSFQQIEESIYKEFSSTGLGLSITKQIVEALNGTVNFSSEYMKGTTFFVKLPVNFKEKENLPTRISQTSSNIENYVFTEKRILIVDDDSINLSIMTAIFENTLLIADTATNGIEALNKTTEFSYDLILMDLQMPILNGYITSQLIHLNTKNAHLPIVAVSANALQNEIDRHRNEIFNDFLIKPISKKVIFEVSYDILTRVDSNKIDTPLNKTFLELLNDFTEISVEDGLIYVNNNQKLYEKIIIEVYEKHHNDFEKLLKCINTNDVIKAQRVLHTLKSLIKTIGLNELYLEVMMIESYSSTIKALTNSMDEIMKTKEKFEKEMYVVNYIYMNHKRGEIDAI